MKQQNKTLKIIKSGFFGVVLLLVLSLIILLGVRLVTGQSLGLRSYLEGKLYFLLNPARAIAGSSSVLTDTQGNLTNIIFLHHSTGNNLVNQGNLKELFQIEGYQLWDHGYNAQGLRAPDRKPTGYSYNVPDDNTDPAGMVQIFRQKVYSLPVNTLSGLLQHEVIVIKSCFAPANNIKNDEQLTQYKDWYREIRSVMDQYPNKVFVILTAPPLNSAETNPEEAARARKFANWLKSEEFLDGHPNIITFDFFDLLASADPASPDYNMLQAAYREGSDSHPNRAANEAIAPVFADFLVSYLEHKVSKFE